VNRFKPIAAMLLSVINFSAGGASPIRAPLRRHAEQQASDQAEFRAAGFGQVIIARCFREAHEYGDAYRADLSAWPRPRDGPELGGITLTYNPQYAD